MKRKKFSLNRLFYNNKIVLAFSIIIAFCLWIKISTGHSEMVVKQVSALPITVNLSESAKESGLKVFGLDDVTAEVSVSGNRIILGQLTKDNIQIFAQQSANLINSTGNYTLELAARKTGVLTDFEFVSTVSPSLVNVFVDRLATRTMDITPEITYHANPKYFSSPVTLSEPTVTISGPESIVSAIAKVTVEGEINGTITQTASLSNLPLHFYDLSGKKITFTNLTFSTTKVDATVFVLNKKVVSISPSFTSSPQEIPFKANKIRVSPPHIEIAADDETLGSISKIETEEIDFSKIDNDHSNFELPLKIPNGCRNLSGIYSANVKLNMSGIQAKKVTVSKIEFTGLTPGKSASSYTLNLNVKVLGPAGEISGLSASNISAQVDLTGKESFTGTTELPAKIVLESKPGCWVYGNYTVNAQIK